LFKTIEQKSIENDAVYLDEIQEGMILQGTVTAIEHFGAFIDIGGIVGLLHISNMNWGYTEDPWEILDIGDKIHTKVIAIDLNTSRFYLGLKQLTENPYTQFINQYPIGTKIKGVVTAFTHTRIIMQLSNGVKGGFIYSNLLEKYKNKIIQSIHIGDEISSHIKGFNKGNHNISLAIDAEEFNNKITDKKLAVLLAFLAKNPMNSTTTGIIKNIEHNNHVIVQFDKKLQGSFTSNNDSFNIGEPIEVKIIKVSHDDRIMLHVEPVNTLTFNMIKEGMILKGIATNIVDYGVFIDLGGISGLLHINEIAWKRPEHPKNIINIDDEIEVKIIQIDHPKKHISLSAKQLIHSPWINIEETYPIGTRIQGKVTSIVAYGCFIEIGNGIKGLLHQSDMLWGNKKPKLSQIVSIGDKKEVMILSINEEKEHISFGLKQCTPNPFEVFIANHNEQDEISGTIKDIKDYGIFIAINEHISALVHYSNIAWDIEMCSDLKTEFYNKIGPSLYKQSALDNFIIGEKITVVILAIDAENKRIGLGIEKLTTISSPLPTLDSKKTSLFIQHNPIGSTVKGQVIIITKDITAIALAKGVVGLVSRKNSRYSATTNAAALWKNYFTQGSELELTIIDIAEDGIISLSIPEIA